MSRPRVNGSSPGDGNWLAFDETKPCERCARRPAMTEAQAQTMVDESLGLLTKVLCSEGNGWHVTVTPPAKGNEPGA